ncbi:MAG: response regulator [Eubacterium sp.]|nr:response regulator [Eubacterium sp.]
MKILVVDDERPARERMVETLGRICPECKVVAFDNAQDALNYEGKSDIEIAFLDIELGNYSGIELAIELKKYSPRCNIIFVTSFSEYGTESFKARPSGYVTKPYTDEEIKRELDNLRYQISESLESSEVSGKSGGSGGNEEITLEKDERRLRCATFGNFIAYKENGDIMTFSRTKSKELLAYLIDCAGFPVTTRDIAKDVFEAELDKQMSKNISKIIIGLISDLKDEGYDDIVIKQNRQIYVNRDKIDCDIYNAINGDVSALNSFHGEYMIEYSWAEISGSVAKIRKI